jgi:phosphatidylserine/phosphatidylglycerophosphate/cardiolipin synthase-like enzyme
VAVRVLTDSDRVEDPYLSTVINGPAIAVLRGAGVPVRVDTPEALLHSKFLVIDDDLAVVGSHNWSAGSYFTFDDLSLALRSAALAAELAARFDGLWAGGVPPP